MNTISRKPVPPNTTAENPPRRLNEVLSASPAPPASATLTAPPNEPAVDELELWSEAKKQLQDLQPWRDYDAVIKLEVQDSGNKSIAEVVMASLNTAKQNYKDTQWSYTRKNGKKIVFASVVDDIATCLDSVKGFGAAAAACDPTKAAGVAWAGIQLMVTASMNNKATRDLVLDDQGFIAQIIQCCAMMERNYIRHAQTARSEPGKELRKVMIELYVKMLLYHVKAFAFMKEWKTVSAISAFAPNQIRTVHKAMNDIKRLFDRVKDWQQNIHGALMQTVTGAATHQQATLGAIQASFGQMTLAVGAMDELLKKIDTRLKDSQPVAPKENRLELLGSEEAITVMYPTEEDVRAIPSNPPWMRLLFLYGKSFPDGLDYVSDEIQRGVEKEAGSQIRLLDTLDVWRVLCAEVSERGHGHTDQVHVNNMIFRVKESKVHLSTLLTELTDQDPRHLTTRIPSLTFAKQMLRNGQVTPGGGFCGEKYHSSKNCETWTFPLAFCMVSIDKEHQVYPEEWFLWGRVTQASLIVIVRDMWSCSNEVTKGGYNMGEVIKEYCDGLSPKDLSVITGSFDRPGWFKLRQEAERYFTTNSSSFEIEDVVTLLESVQKRPKRALQNDWIARVKNEAEAYFQERARWLLLAALLNLSSNWWRADSFPKSFERLLMHEYCNI